MSTSPVKSGQRYEGAPGTTRIERVHVSCVCGAVLSAEVHRAVDASANPELAQRLLTEDPRRQLNAVQCPAGDRVRVTVPVIYHDPDNRLFVLVLDESQRHRELHERAALYAELAGDAAVPVPEYVRRAPVVFGGAGLRAFLEEQAERALDEARTADRMRELERMREQLDKRQRDLDGQRAELDRMMHDIDRRGREVDEGRAALAERIEALTAREQQLERRAAERERAPAAAAVRPPEPARRDEAPVAVPEERTGATQPVAERPATTPLDAAELDRDEEVTGSRPLPAEPQPAAAGKGRAGLARPPSPFEHTTVDSTPLPDPLPYHEASKTQPFELVPADPALLGLAAGQTLVTDEPRATERREPEVVDGATRVTGNRDDVAIERWIVSRSPSMITVAESGQVRVAISGDVAEVEPLLGDAIELRLQLHRFPSYPLVTLALAPPADFAGPDGPGRPYVLQLDVEAPADRAALQALQRRFTFSLELFDTEYLPVRKRIVAADLAENAAYVLAAADAHMQAVHPQERSFGKASIAWSNPRHDTFGWSHPDRPELREDKLTALATANQVRRALHIVRRFSTPEREEYLFLTRGYPIALWRRHRRAVLQRALELGLWMGPRLAQAMVADGLVRSVKDLVRGLQPAFAQLCDGDPANDLDDDAIADNWSHLAQEAGALGIDFEGPAPPSPWTDDDGTGATPVDPRTPGEDTADLDAEDLVELEEEITSGTIGGTQVSRAAAAAANLGAHDRSMAELIGLLEDKDRRLDAAVELARRGEERSIGPVFNTLRRMTRGEAVRVLGTVIGFGDRATTPLLEGLRSRKAFLRQGAALALAVLGNEEAVEALSDVLLTEPTDIWREIARAFGEVGPDALMSLLSRLASRSPEHAPDKAERLTWALAHIAARGGRPQVETLAHGRDPGAAGIARAALDLTEQARAEEHEVRGPHTSRDQTVNRAFTRRFFQALAAARPGGDLSGVPLPHPGADVSAPAMMLDEADLLEAADFEDAEQLDENDLIPT